MYKLTIIDITVNPIIKRNELHFNHNGKTHATDCAAFATVRAK